MSIETQVKVSRMEIFDWLKNRIRKWVTPRQNTDMESEILNIVSAPIYVYTITSVYYYSWFYVMPYHCNAQHARQSSGSMEDGLQADYGNHPLLLLMHRILLTLIYFEMMTNWLCIRFVGNKIDKSIKPAGLNDICAQRNGVSGQTKLSSSKNGNFSFSVIVDSETKAKTRGTSRNSNTTAVSEDKQSYWAWHFCRKCGHDSPPRCHHCPMCETCVLKRDHHCFFSGRCVGFRNQRYFIVFLVWAVFGTSYSTLYFIPYLRHELWQNMLAVDLIPPFSLLRWIFGTGSGFVTNVMFAYLFNFLFIFLSLTFLLEQYSLICSGLTQFESKGLNPKKLNIVDPRELRDKMKAVMGHYFGISLFLPSLHLVFKPCEDPYEWPELKIYRGNGRGK